ncbi:MAG: hypothetical protein ACT4OI_07035, partial [Methanobacteriota archaeon]
KKLDPEAIARFHRELADLGYKFQFITLAGFHSLNLSMFRLAKGYKEHGMAAYAAHQDEEFAAKAEGFRATEHQTFVGTAYFDEVSNVIAGGHATTLAMEGSTERDQFQEKGRPANGRRKRRNGAPARR